MRMTNPRILSCGKGNFMFLGILAMHHKVRGTPRHQDGHQSKQKSFNSFALITYFYLNLDFEVKTTYVAGCWCWEVQELASQLFAPSFYPQNTSTPMTLWVSISLSLRSNNNCLIRELTGKECGAVCEWPGVQNCSDWPPAWGHEGQSRQYRKDCTWTRYCRLRTWWWHTRHMRCW